MTPARNNVRLFLAWVEKRCGTLNPFCLATPGFFVLKEKGKKKESAFPPTLCCESKPIVLLNVAQLLPPSRH